MLVVEDRAGGAEEWLGFKNHQCLVRTIVRTWYEGILLHYETGAVTKYEIYASKLTCGVVNLHLPINWAEEEKLLFQFSVRSYKKCFAAPAVSKLFPFHAELAVWV